MKTFHVNYFWDKPGFKLINFINQLPCWILMLLFFVWPKDSQFYPVVVIGFVTSTLLAFIPFYTNAKLYFSDLALEINGKGEKIIIPYSSIRNVSYTIIDVHRNQKFVEFIISLSDGRMERFYVGRYLLESPYKRQKKILDSLREVNQLRDVFGRQADIG